MNIPQKIKALNLPDGSFIVVGSGILSALNIRESNDIDLVVSDELYEKFKNQKWTHDNWGDQVVLKHDVFDLGKRWYGKTVDELLESAQYVDGVPYLSLDHVYAWKQSLGREKDVRDLQLIEDYQKRSS